MFTVEESRKYYELLTDEELQHYYEVDQAHPLRPSNQTFEEWLVAKASDSAYCEAHDC